MGYTLHVLDDKDFDALRIKNPRYHTEDALGFADVKAKTAYVRRTGINTLDQFVTAHELEELVNKYSEHEVDGIRYKKGGAARSILPTVLGAIATLFTGPIGGAIVGGLSGGGMNAYAANKHEELGNPAIAGLTGAATGALGGVSAGKLAQGAISGATNAAPGFLSKAAGAAKGAVGIVPEAASSGPLTSAFNASQAVNPALSEAVKFGGGTSALTGGVNRGLSAAAGALPAAGAVLNFTTPKFEPAPIGSNFSNAQPASTGNYSLTNPSALEGQTGKIADNLSFSNPSSTSASQNLTSANSLGFQGAGEAGEVIAKKSILDRVWEKFNTPLGQTAAGASIPLIGSAFAPKVEPYNPQESQMFQDLSQRITTGAPKLTMTPEQKQSITANYDNQLETARQEIVNRWKATRPGSDITNDTQLQQAIRELESEFAIQKANAITSTELGLTQQQTQMMSELASMDINSLSMRAGIKAQEAKEFKEMLSNMGFMVAGNTIYNK